MNTNVDFNKMLIDSVNHFFGAITEDDLIGMYEKLLYSKGKSSLYVQFRSDHYPALYKYAKANKSITVSVSDYREMMIERVGNEIYLVMGFTWKVDNKYVKVAIKLSDIYSVKFIVA